MSLPSLFDDDQAPPLLFARPAKVGEEYQSTGTVRHVRFQSDDGIFAILELATDNGQRATLKGALGALQADDRVRVWGRWVASKYGEQLEAERYEVLLPVTRDGVRKFLSGQLTGVGPKTAQSIVDTFGEDTVKVLDETPERLGEVPGLGPKRVASIIEEWRERHGQRTAMMFLQSHGLAMGMAMRLLRQFGNEAVNVVRRDPYRLARDVRGVGFLTADRIALSMGFSREGEARIEAGVQHILHECEHGMGHCYMLSEHVADEAAKMLEVDLMLVEQAVRQLASVGDIVIEDFVDGEAVFSKRAWRAETAVARHARRLIVHTPGPVINRKGEVIEESKLVRSLELTLGLELAPAQRRAVEGALTGKMVVVTGGPGTGKTTLVKLVVESCVRLGWPVYLAAPTGRAAKRLFEATDHEAKTIHRMLEFSFQAGGFQRNSDSPLPVGMYVVDETSMIDIFLMRAMLEALPSDARLVLVGDVDQLPSVGPGTVLRDFIASDVVPVVQLSQVFRQASASLIVRNAHRINQGQMPILPNQKAGEPIDYFGIPTNSGKEAEDLVVELVVDRLPRTFGFDPMTDIQVLSPMRSREAGVDRLNAALQAALNPDGLPFGGGDPKLRVGDRVMQLRNDYDKNVYNGDVGWVVEWRKASREALVRFDDRIVRYAISDLEDLSLAYASTVHKAQGSEYPAVIVPLLRSHYKLLQRNLVYTALTRARRLAVFVGDPSALRIAVANSQPNARNTRLAFRLAQDRY